METGFRIRSCAEKKTSDGTAHRRRPLALWYLLARPMGGVARRYADDAHRRRGHAGALAARSPRHAGGGGNLPAAVAPAVAVCGGDPAVVHRAAAFSRHR